MVAAISRSGRTRRNLHRELVPVVNYSSRNRTGQPRASARRFAGAWRLVPVSKADHRRCMDHVPPGERGGCRLPGAERRQTVRSLVALNFELQPSRVGSRRSLGRVGWRHTGSKGRRVRCRCSMPCSPGFTTGNPVLGRRCARRQHPDLLTAKGLLVTAPASFLPPSLASSSMSSHRTWSDPPDHVRCCAAQASGAEPEEQAVDAAGWPAPPSSSDPVRARRGPQLSFEDSPRRPWQSPHQLTVVVRPPSPALTAAQVPPRSGPSAPGHQRYPILSIARQSWIIAATTN